MTRLIDADALAKKLNTFNDRMNGNEHFLNGIESAKEIIENEPTIDAEPVRHGKWIGYAGTIGNECSVCGKWIDVLQGTAEMNYCPNCGARMDEE